MVLAKARCKGLLIGQQLGEFLGCAFIRDEPVWGTREMIKLTRLDGQAFILNADLIRYVEERPDTYVTLTSGDRIVVSETMDRVVELTIDYQQRKAMLPGMPNRFSLAANEQ